MSKKDKELHDLVYVRHMDNKAPTWDCVDCGEEIHTQIDGAALTGLLNAQAQHDCPKDLAEKRLPVGRIRLREVLDELGMRIEILWTSYESAELMLVDKKTGAQLLLESETLG